MQNDDGHHRCCRELSSKFWVLGRTSHRSFVSFCLPCHSFVVFSTVQQYFSYKSADSRTQLLSSESRLTNFFFVWPNLETETIRIPSQVASFAYSRRYLPGSNCAVISFCRSSSLSLKFF